MTCGIYEIVNTVNSKRYVGSSVDIDSRWQTHIRELRRGTHHAQHLQRSFNKHGEDAFVIRCITECEREELIPLEQAELDYGYDYNSSPTAGNTLGLKFSDEARERVRQNRRDRYAECRDFREHMLTMSRMPKSEVWRKNMSDRMSRLDRDESWTKSMEMARAELTKDQVLRVRELRSSGFSLNDISSATGVSWSQCQRICAGERYQWAYDYSGPVPFDNYASRRKKKAPEGA